MIRRAWRALRRRSSEPVAFGLQTGAELAFEELPAPRRERLGILQDAADRVAYRHWYNPNTAPPAETPGEWIEAQNYRPDGRGVAMVPYDWGREYNPLVLGMQGWIAHAALWNPDAEVRRLGAMQLLVLTELYERQAREEGGLALWHYTFPIGDIDRPWASCLSQAAIVHTLLRLHEISEDATALELARAGARACITPIDEGGVARLDAAGDLWMEEYTHTEDLIHVLNGFMSALLLVVGNSRYLAPIPSLETRKRWFQALRRAFRSYTEDRRVLYGAAGGTTSGPYLQQMLTQLPWLQALDPEADDTYSWATEAWTSLLPRHLRPGAH